MTTRFVTLLLLSEACFAGKELPLRWGDLEGWARPDAQIRLKLLDGSTVEGRLTLVSDDALTVSILRSSNERKHALREEVLERTSIRGVELRIDRKSGRKKGLAIGAVVGVLLGAFGGALSDKPPGESAALGVVVGAAAGAAIYGGIGYMIGRGSDLAWTPVTLKPDP